MKTVLPEIHRPSTTPSPPDPLHPARPSRANALNRQGPGKW
jgi:hypothetical protein